MSNIDIVFGFTKKIESYLEKEFKAEGRGLHTKVSSVDYRLPVALIKKTVGLQRLEITWRIRKALN